MIQFYAWLGERKSSRVRLAVMDMWKPFRLATNARAPQAAILFDKFHVIRHLGEALDAVRKSEYARLAGRQRRYIKGQKYTLLSRRENLTLNGKKALKALLSANKRLNTAYVLKESFGQLWSYERESWARRFFENWRASLKWQRLKPYEKFAAMIDRHWDGIAAYCRLENKEQGLARFRRGAQQQDPGDPTARLRLAQRGLSAAQNPDLHAAGPIAHLKVRPNLARDVDCRCAGSTAPRRPTDNRPRKAVDMVDNASALPTWPTTATTIEAGADRKLG